MPSGVPSIARWRLATYIALCLFMPIFLVGLFLGGGGGGIALIICALLFSTVMTLFFPDDRPFWMRALRSFAAVVSIMGASIAFLAFSS